MNKNFCHFMYITLPKYTSSILLTFLSNDRPKRKIQRRWKCSSELTNNFYSCYLKY